LVLRIGLVALLIVAAGVGAWLYAQRDAIERRRAVLRVGEAQTYAAAQAELRWFETPPQAEEKLAALAGYWGEGNENFDSHLARHLSEPACSDALRKRFSEELAWRPKLQRKWAEAWRRNTKLPPDQEIASIVDFLDTLTLAESPPKLTWRQVLNAQAVFELRGRGDLVAWLTPENCLERYQRLKGDGEK
jgi:hypothetical protein